MAGGLLLQMLSERDTPDQDRVVDAAVALLAGLEGTPAGLPQRPDQRNRRSKDIDATVEIGSRLYALEHTRVEQFPDALQRTAFLQRNQAVIDAFSERLAQKMPPGDYDVLFHERLVVPQREIEAFFARIEREILTLAQDIPPPGNNYSNIRTGRVEMNRCKAGFRLVRGFDSPAGKRSIEIDFLHGFSSAGERGERVAVLERLVASKTAKLQRYAATHLTVLVLEDAAFMATPYRLLLLAADAARRTETGSVDFVVVVSCEPDIWSLQFARKTDALSRELYKSNWWVMDPSNGRLVQRPWDADSSRSLLA